jgi:hypothetical protein
VIYIQVAELVIELEQGLTFRYVGKLQDLKKCLPRSLHTGEGYTQPAASRTTTTHHEVVGAVFCACHYSSEVKHDTAAPASSTIAYQVTSRSSIKPSNELGEEKRFCNRNGACLNGLSRFNEEPD